MGAWCTGPKRRTDQVLRFKARENKAQLSATIIVNIGALLSTSLSAANLPDIVDNLKEAVEHEAQNAVEQAGEAIDKVVEVISDVVSDTIATVAGWFS